MRTRLRSLTGWLGAAGVCAAGCGDEKVGDGLFSTGADGGVTLTDTGEAEAGDGDGDGDGETVGDGDGDGDGDGPRFDIEMETAGDEGGGECGCGNDEWSYIWIANSSASTVSKINTKTVQEEGRYITRPDKAGNPSRTSVSLGGRAVAVANRYGGVVKVFARDQFCPDQNNDNVITTSKGAGDVLPWGDDECIAWYTAFPNYTTQRPVAWAGDVNPQTCDDEALWTAGCGGGFAPGFGGNGNVFVHRLDGVDGSVDQTVEVSGFGCGGFGAYGGAADGDGNFWIAHNGTGGKLAYIDHDSLDFEVHAFPGNGFAGYGITVDTKGRPWVSSYGGNLGAGVFDPDTNTWQTVPGFASQGGIQQGEDKRIWVTTVQGFGGGLNQNGIVSVDPDTAMVLDSSPVPNGTVKGLSLDVDGYVWAVTGVAHKIDPDSLQTAASYQGLSGPYTYSDMTGWGLQNAACNPEG